MGIRVLFIEDQPGLRRVLQLAFPAPEFETRVAADGDEGLAMALAAPPEVLVVDMMLPGRSGLEVSAQIGRAHV